MSDKQYKWKQISKENQRLNCLLGKKKDLPNKFHPSRMRSESADKTMNLERSVVVSNSIQRSTLNLTREQDSVERTKLSKYTPKKDRSDSKLKTNVIQMNSLHMGTKQSSLYEKETLSKMRNSNQAIADIKKEFIAFRQNIFQEVQRQKLFVIQLVKDVLLTLQFELEKMGRMVSVDNTLDVNKISSLSKQSAQLKTLEQLKVSIQGTGFTPIQKNISANFSIKKRQSKQQNITTKSKEESLMPPSSQLDISEFLAGLQNIKKQINDMDVLLLDGNPQIQFANVVKR